MAAVGVFVWLQFGWIGEVPAMRQPVDRSGFAPLVLLRVLAMFTLPHQFHMGVVECRQPTHVRSARWLFQLYMLLIALPMLRLSRLGDAWLSGRGMSSDLYVLALPLCKGSRRWPCSAFSVV